MRAHPDRVEYFHFKSVDAQVQQRVERDGIPFARAVAEGVFCEPDRGAVAFRDMARLLGEIGFTGHATVEQDMYPAPADKPLPIAKHTYRYLREVGF